VGGGVGVEAGVASGITALVASGAAPRLTGEDADVTLVDFRFREAAGGWVARPTIGESVDAGAGRISGVTISISPLTTVSGCGAGSLVEVAVVDGEPLVGCGASPIGAHAAMSASAKIPNTPISCRMYRFAVVVFEIGALKSADPALLTTFSHRLPCR